MCLHAERSAHRQMDEILTFHEITYKYIYEDQSEKVMREIRKMLYMVNTCLVKAFNSYLDTNFTKFKPFLPTPVNVMRAQIHRNANIIYFVNRKVNFQVACPHLSNAERINRLNKDLMAIISSFKYFVAAQLSTAVFK